MKAEVILNFMVTLRKLELQEIYLADPKVYKFIERMADIYYDTTERRRDKDVDKIEFFNADS